MLSLLRSLLAASLLFSTCIMDSVPAQDGPRPIVPDKIQQPATPLPEGPQPLLNPVHLPQRNRSPRQDLTLASKTARLSR